MCEVKHIVFQSNQEITNEIELESTLFLSAHV